ncbi:hypothetical protein AMTRI_Chr03g54300 [Amborella trichopoda]
MLLYFHQKKKTCYSDHTIKHIVGASQKREFCQEFGYGAWGLEILNKPRATMEEISPKFEVLIQRDEETKGKLGFWAPYLFSSFPLRDVPGSKPPLLLSDHLAQTHMKNFTK